MWPSPPSALPHSSSLENTRAPSLGKDNDRSTGICFWLSPLPGLPFLCLLGTAGAGQECLCLGLVQVPTMAGLRGALSATCGSCTQATPLGGSSLHFAQTKCLGRGRTRHTLENMNFQGTMEPRTHYRLQKDPATLAKQVTRLQCFSRGQRAG